MEQITPDPEIEKINNLSHYEMGYLWRYAEAGHRYFDSSKPYFEIFSKRFQELGGMTPALSKALSL